MNRTPTSNLSAYAILFEIENGLRGLVVGKCDSAMGAKWYKDLPKDLQEKYVNGIAYDRKSAWRKLVVHHPVYYLDFPDLMKIIENGAFWNKVFSHIFIDKTVVSGILKSIEGIRNSVAHNRVILESDVDLLNTAKTSLITAVGQERWELLSGGIEACDLMKKLAEYREQCLEAVRVMDNRSAPPEFEFCKAIKNVWWFDETQIGNNYSAISTFVTRYEQYSSLPRKRGSGAQIDKWFLSSYSVSIGDDANRAFAELIQRCKHAVS